MVEFLYFAIGCELVLVFFLVSFFKEKTQKDRKMLTIDCVIMLLFWPVILVKIIIDVIKDKIVNDKIKK